jgi:hypothetical protein
MLKRLLFFLLFILIASTLIISCSTSPQESDGAEENNISTEDQKNQLTTDALDVFIEESSDAGQKYIDSFIFLGESTTYHLKSRGVLSGGTETTQVWAPKSGTLMLDHTISECRIVYPQSKAEMELGEALRHNKPKYILLTFGLNGAVASVSRGENYFKGCYGKLIDTVSDNSPDTKIILQSCFPVARNMDVSNFSVDVKKLNQCIDILNEWASELALERGIGYLNSSEIFKDSEGFLIDKYQSGDGYHLTAEAYKKMLYYMRTHAYEVDN